MDPASEPSPAGLLLLRRRWALTPLLSLALLLLLLTWRRPISRVVPSLLLLLLMMRWGWSTSWVVAALLLWQRRSSSSLRTTRVEPRIWLLARTGLVVSTLGGCRPRRLLGSQARPVLLRRRWSSSRLLRRSTVHPARLRPRDGSRVVQLLGLRTSVGETGRGCRG